MAGRKKSAVVHYRTRPSRKLVIQVLCARKDMTVEQLVHDALEKRHGREYRELLSRFKEEEANAAA
jgi:hypothetical protein